MGQQLQTQATTTTDKTPFLVRIHWNGQTQNMNVHAATMDEALRLVDVITSYEAKIIACEARKTIPPTE